MEGGGDGLDIWRPSTSNRFAKVAGLKDAESTGCHGDLWQGGRAKEGGERLPCTRECLPLRERRGRHEERAERSAPRVNSGGIQIRARRRDRSGAEAAPVVADTFLRRACVCGAVLSTVQSRASAFAPACVPCHPLAGEDELITRRLWPGLASPSPSPSPNASPVSLGAHPKPPRPQREREKKEGLSFCLAAPAHLHTVSHSSRSDRSVVPVSLVAGRACRPLSLSLPVSFLPCF